MVIGYTTGVFDLFHVGHVTLLQRARGLCDRLIVGVSTDELVSYKFKKAVIPFEDRLKVVASCRFVDAAIAQEDMNKLDAHSKINFDIMFVGDDWYKTPKWNVIESDLEERGVRVVYLPYTKSVSSTMINNKLSELRN